MLYLLPNLLASTEEHHSLFLPKGVDEAIFSLDGMVAESEKGARRYLCRFSFKGEKSFRDLPLLLLNEHTSEEEFQTLVSCVEKGGTWGLVSDAGLPCLADPGARLVFALRKKKIAVRAFSGPSAITLALMLSGFSAQAFAFHGYLPKERKKREALLMELMRRTRSEGSTQLFIEAPYRTASLLKELLEILDERLFLCLALDLTLPSEEVIVLSVKEWKKENMLQRFDKRPAVFLFSGYTQTT